MRRSREELMSRSNLTTQHRLTQHIRYGLSPLSYGIVPLGRNVVYARDVSNVVCSLFLIINPFQELFLSPEICSSYRIPLH
jgi:hypothetical protein